MAPLDTRAHLERTAARGIRATVLGVFASAVLASIKVGAGLLGHSYALIADGIESMLDIMSSLVVWGGLRVAARRPTERHPYGFGKAEPLAALAVATALVLAAGGLAVQSVREILTPHHAPEFFTLPVLVIVVGAKELMYRVMRNAGETIGSAALKTDAWHHRSDALTSLAAFVGILVAVMGGEGYESADDWAALLACGIIGFNGARLFRGALIDVLDVAPAPQVVDRIRNVASGVRDVRGVEKCHVRKSGLVLHCDIHIEVDGSLSVRDGHRIAHEVKDALLTAERSLSDVVVHVEPNDGEEVGRDLEAQAD